MVEKIKYSILQEFKKIQIRKYPPLLIASAENIDDTTAFRILFDYISGNNQSQQKIAMTAPVLSSEKIPMTAPVISASNVLSFVLPSTYTIDTAPDPNNTHITLKNIPERIVAVISFSGKSNEKDIKKYSNELSLFLQKKQLEPRGEMFLMRYNSPFMPGIFRRNELGIEVIHYKQ